MKIQFRNKITKTIRESDSGLFVLYGKVKYFYEDENDEGDLVGFLEDMDDLEAFVEIGNKQFPVE
jgi:hypothetical protein